MLEPGAAGTSRNGNEPEPVDQVDISSDLDAENMPTSKTVKQRQALLDTNLFVSCRATKNKLDEAVAKFVSSSCSPYYIV